MAGKKNPLRGFTVEDWLAEDGILEEYRAAKGSAPAAIRSIEDRCSR
jgi:hypothetical protein